MDNIIDVPYEYGAKKSQITKTKWSTHTTNGTGSAMENTVRNIKMTDLLRFPARWRMTPAPTGGKNKRMGGDMPETERSRKKDQKRNNN